MPDLAGIFGANLFSASGSANGVKQAGKAGAIKIAAFDAPTSVVQELKDGTFTVDHRPASGRDRLFRRGLRLCPPHRQSVPTSIGTGFTVMTKDNIDDPKVKRFLYTS